MAQRTASRSKLRKHAVTRGFNDAAAIAVNLRVDQFPSMCHLAGVNTGFIRLHQP